MIRNAWPNRFLLVLAALLAVALVAAACGGDDDDGGDDGGGDATATSAGDDDSGDDDGSGEPELDVCSLITSEEASTALGEDVTSVEPENFPPLYSCTYDAPNGVITLTVVTGTSEEVEHVYDIGTEGYEEVDGVGEKAHWSGSPTDTLEALDGNYNVSISVFSLGDEELDYKALSIELAENALGRLP